MRLQFWLLLFIVRTEFQPRCSQETERAESLANIDISATAARLAQGCFADERSPGDLRRIPDITNALDVLSRASGARP